MVAEYDDNSGCWNGRYRILNDDGVVAYESFVKPLSNQDEANEAAKIAARAWIDCESLK